MTPTPLLVLWGQAFALLFKRWPLYLAIAVAAIALQGALLALWRGPQVVGLFVVSFITTTVVQGIVYAFVARDARENQDEAQPVWGRILERTWALIVIDFLLWYFVGNGLPRDGSLVAYLVFALATFVWAFLIFSDVSAMIDDDDGGPLLLVPRSFWRSIVTTRDPHVLWQAVALALLSDLAALTMGGLESILDGYHLTNAAFWVDIPLGTLLTLPLAALTTVVYLNAKRR